MFKKDEDVEFIEEHLQNNRIKKYIKGRTLGKGGFAECYQFLSQQTGKRYAAKVIDKESLSKGKTKQKLQSEIVIHKQLYHRNIVKFQHYFEDHNFVYILLQLCNNNTLNQILKRRKVLSQIQVKFYMIQLLHALKYIHSQKVIHRDLKLGNFFLSDNLQLKVGDFGLATTITHQGQRRKTMCGTPNYIAPQILQSKKGHSFEVDIWSTGVITYALLFGKPPFQTNEVKLTYQRIKSCDFTFPKFNVSNSAKDFISRMLILNPYERASLGQLLNHDFITQQNIPKSLPLSTLACPPSKLFIEGLKHVQKTSSLSKNNNETFQQNINSSRTSKYSQKQRNLVICEKLNLQLLCSKAQKSERSQGSICRNPSSSTTTLNRKALGFHNYQKSHLLVSFFQQEPKYGLFYKLGNGVTGMKFNDQTCVVSNIKFNRFHYISLQNNQQKDNIIFQNGQEPKSLEKKMKIINHFAKILAPKYENLNDPPNPLKKLKAQSDSFPIHVHSYYVTNHYTLFIMNIGLFQAKFKDKSQIILDDTQVIFLTKDKNFVIMRPQALDNQNQQLKIKYNHVSGLIIKLKKAKRETPNQEKKEKQNTSISQSNSQSKLSKNKQLPTKRQFSSTTNLHNSKKPLYQSITGRQKVQLLRNKQKLF